MPDQPPAFRPRLQPERKAWQPARGALDKRKRGRAGQRDRAQVVLEEPHCRRCFEQGRISPTEEVDHIVPLSEGGKDVRANKQGLCKPCHDAKSKAERAEAAARRRRA